MATYTWAPSTDSPLPTDYELEKSTDGGLTWTALATVPHDTAGANYDSENCVFFYVDGSPVAGEIVRIQSVDSLDASRNSAFSFIHAAPAVPQTLHLFGNVVDATTGEVRAGIEVRILPVAEESSTFVPAGGDPGVPGTFPRNLLGHKRTQTIFTDSRGAWSIDLLRDLPVEIQIPSTGYCLRIRTPKDRDILNVVDAYVYRIGRGQEQRVPYEYGQGSGYVT